ncbi:hypothetical protein FBU30_002386, partial [Linnemannia zychae]
KRKRERVRAAWVESVFGTNGSGISQRRASTIPYTNTTMSSIMTNHLMSNINQPGGGGYQQRNLFEESNSIITNLQTDRGMAERRQSIASTVAGVAATPMSAGIIEGGGQELETRRESTMSRSVQNAVMLPAAVHGSYGVVPTTPCWNNEGSHFNIQSPEQQDSFHHQRQHHHNHYEEFFDQNECDAEVAELTHLAIDYSPGPEIALATSPTRAQVIQRPATAVYSKNSKGIRTSIHPHSSEGSSFDQPTLASRGNNTDANECYANDPFQDRREHSQQQQHQQRHSMHALRGGVLAHCTSGVPEYRRPHSFSAGSREVIRGRERTGEDSEPKTLYYKTHVLDESSDQESIVDNDITTNGTSVVTSGNTTVGRLAGNLLKEHFRRLSTPYVKAIRDQQQLMSPTLACIGEGGGGGGSHGQKRKGDVDLTGNGFDSSMPVPGPAPSTIEKRWSRALLKGVVGSSYHQHHSSEEVVIEESLSGGDEDIEDRDHRRSGKGDGRSHRQVHSGSLASFRGLDDPSNPRLRVMNPDDGT